MANLLDDIADMEVSAPCTSVISAAPSGSANRSGYGKFSFYGVIVTDPRPLTSDKQPMTVRVMLLGPLNKTIIPSSNNTMDKFEDGGFKFVVVPSQRQDNDEGKQKKVEFEADPANSGKKFVYPRLLRPEKRTTLKTGSIMSVEIARTNNDSLKEFKATRAVKDLVSEVDLFEVGFVFQFNVSEALFSSYISKAVGKEGTTVERVSLTAKTFDFVGHASMLRGDVAGWFNRTLQVAGMTTMEELAPLVIDPRYNFSTSRLEKTEQEQQSVQGKAIKDTKGRCLTAESRKIVDRYDVLVGQPPRTQNPKRDYNEKDAELYITGFEHQGETIQPPFEVSVMRIKNTTAAPIPDNFSFQKDGSRKPLYKSAGVTRQIVRKNGKVKKQDFATSMVAFENAMSAAGIENDIHRVNLLPFMLQNTGFLLFAYTKMDTATYMSQLASPPRLDFSLSGKPGTKKNTGFLCDLVAAVLNSSYGINWDTTLKLFKRGQCFDEGVINVNMKLTGENHFLPIMQTVQDNKNKTKVPAVINLTECKYKLEDLKKAGTHDTFLLFNLAQKCKTEMTYLKLVETAGEMIKEAEESFVATLAEEGKEDAEIELARKKRFDDKLDRNLFNALATVVGDTILASLPKHEDDPDDYKYPTKDLETIFALGDEYPIHWTVFAIEKSLIKERGLENYIGCCVEEDRIWPPFQEEEKRMMIQAHNEKKNAAVAAESAVSAFQHQKEQDPAAYHLDCLEQEAQLSSPPRSPRYYTREIEKAKQAVLPSLGGTKRMMDDDEEDAPTGDKKRTADQEEDDEMAAVSLPAGLL